MPRVTIIFAMEVHSGGIIQRFSSEPWKDLSSASWSSPSSPYAATAAESLQSCPTLCDPIDGSPPGSPVPGILQAGTLEWVAISFSNAWKWKVKVKLLSRVRLLATPWPAAHQAPPHEQVTVRSSDSFSLRLEPAHCSMSGSYCCFLVHTQVLSILCALQMNPNLNFLWNLGKKQNYTSS